nr:retrotransposon protein, putative, unclassified [Tanacetum cinerariifolium]
MRIEQYFLMTDYSLWEVILNGDSPAPTRVVEGVLQPVAPTTAEQMLARKNELKPRGTLLMALPDKHQLKFNSYKDAKTLILKIYEAKVKNSSSIGTTTQNLAFVSSSNTDSTTESVSTTASVSAVCAKMLVSSLPNVDSLSNAMIYSLFASQTSSPQLDNKDLKQIDADDLEEMDLKWQMAMWSVITTTRMEILQGSVEEEPASYALMAFSSLSSSSDNKVVSCSKACLESVEARLLVYKQNESIFEEDIKLLKLEVQLRESDESWPPSSLYDRFQPSDGYHVIPPLYTRTFMPPKPDLIFNTTPTAVETDHSTFNVQLSPTKPDQDLSHTNRPTIPIIKDRISDSEDESETKAPQIVPNFVQSTKQVKSPRHSVQHVETSIPVVTHKLASPKPTSNGKKRNRKAFFIPVSTVVPKTSVTRPKQLKPIVTKLNSPTRRHTTHSPSKKSSNSPPIVTAVKAPVVNVAQVSNGFGPKENLTIQFLVQVNPQHTLKDKGVIDSGCSRHMTGNMSCLFDFEELNGGYVAFGVIDDYSRFTWVFFLATKDETSLLRKTFITGLENQLSLKAEAVNTACYVHNRVLVTKPHNKTPYELLHGRTPSIGFMRPFGCPVTILNTLDSLGKFDGKVDEGFLVGYSVSSKAFRVFNSRTRFVQETLHNTDGDAAFDGKEPEFDEKKPESEFNVSPSCSAQLKKQDDKTKREAKGKSHVESFTGYRNLSAEFKDCFDNSINEVNAVDTSQLPNDSDMLELKDITYSNDEDDVGAKADFNNLETSITSAFLYGTIKEEVYVCQPLGFEDLDHPNKVYKVVKALYGLHQAPKAWYETLANYLLENRFQRGKIDQTLFIKRQKGELTFFLGLQVNKKKDGIFINQDKYIVEILRKFRLTEGKSASTPIDTKKPLLKDPDGEDIDVHTYRLMIGLLMYLTSSIPDIMFAFWTTVAVKKVNDVIRLQALVDKKKVVVTKAKIREALHLDDAEGVKCLPMKKSLQNWPEWCMSAKRTSWNELSSSMASAVICLSSGRKINFSKYIFDSLVRNVDSPSKFYMYNRFLQLMIRKQVGDLSTHTTKYTSHALTQKVLFWVKTSLFDGMLVAQEVVAEGDDEVHGEEVNAGDAAEGDVSAAHDEVPTVAKEPSIPSTTPPTLPPQPSQDITSTSHIQPTPPQSPQDDKEVADEAKEVVEDAKVDDSADIYGRTTESQAEIYKIDLDHANKVLSMQDDETEPAEVQEVVDVVTIAKLITKVVTAASETITTAKSMLNRDSSVISSSSKIDSLLDEFVGELALLKSILPGIDKTDCHPENEIRLFQRLFNSHIEEIDLSFNSDDPMPPSIEDDDNDSEGDNLFPGILLHDDPITLPDTLDFSNVVRVFLPFFTYPMTSLILLSSGSEDTIFDPGITIYRFYSF